MALLVQPRLVNEPFSDATLFLDFRFGRRALLFDLGDLAPLSAREILRVSHAFVSHTHMDHFSGFDRLLRLQLYRDATVRLLGPPGLCGAVEAKLAAYAWNLLGPHSADFRIEAFDWSGTGFSRGCRFAARESFRRREIEPPRTAAPGVVHDEGEFRVEAAMLDHGIPCLAFALQEKLRVNVHKPRLDALGLAVGAWLTEAKRAMREGRSLDAPFEAGSGRNVSLGTLLGAGALVAGPGQRVAYATDFAFREANVEKVITLARGARSLFIEAGFLEEDAELAASKHHLTALQAGRIARAAGAAQATPMHFSARYAEREAALRAEFARAFRGET